MSGELNNTESNSNMENDLTVSTKDVGFWKEMWHQVRLVFHLVRDPNVPLYLKLLPLAAVIYVLIPTDFIPDVFPIVGQLDDITALIVGGKVFIELSPQNVVAQYVQSMRRRDDETPQDENRGGDDISQAGNEGGVILEGDYEQIDPEE